MKRIISLIVMLVGLSVFAQTNVINIYNSTVTIQNSVVPSGTNAVVTESNKLVYLSPELMDRLTNAKIRDEMLEQRRKASFDSFLRKNYGQKDFLRR